MRSRGDMGMKNTNVTNYDELHEVSEGILLVLVLRK